jgi:adenylate cyclase
MASLNLSEAPISYRGRVMTYAIPLDPVPRRTFNENPMRNLLPSRGTCWSRLLRAGLLLIAPLFVPALFAQQDSLLAVWADTTRSREERFQAAHEAWQILRRSNNERAWELIDEIRAEAVARKYRREEASALHYKGMMHKDREEYPPALELYQAALALFNDLGMQREAGVLEASIANVYKHTAQFPRAVEWYQRALEHVTAAQDTNNIASVHYNLGNLWSELRWLDRAETHFELALKYARKPSERMFGEAAFGYLAIDREEPEKALVAFRKAQAIARDMQNWTMVMNFDNWMGSAFLMLGQVDSADACYANARRLVANDPGSMNRVFTAMGQAEVEMARKHHRIALPLLQEAEQLMAALPMMPEHKQLYENLLAVHRELGNAGEALWYSDRLRMVNDSMNLLEAQRVLSERDFRQQLQADSLRTEEEKRIMQEQAAMELRTERIRRFGFMGGGAGALILAFLLWRRLGRTRREKAQSEEILHSVLPEEVAREIRETGQARNKHIDQVSVLFTDFQGFTELSAQISQQELTDEISACFTAFDAILARHQVEKIKTIGDAYMAAAGLQQVREDAAARAVTAALEMQAFVEARHAERSQQGQPAFRMRVGIHTGPVVAGIVGVKKFQYDIWGDTVNTASRMESSGEVGRVNISEATYSLLKEDPHFHFTPRGKVEAKGKGEVEMWFAQGAVVEVIERAF